MFLSNWLNKFLRTKSCGTYDLCDKQLLQFLYCSLLSKESSEDKTRSYILFMVKKTKVSFVRHVSNFASQMTLDKSKYGATLIDDRFPVIFLNGRPFAVGHIFYGWKSLGLKFSKCNSQFK